MSPTAPASASVSEGRRRSPLFTASPLAILVLDGSGRVVEANPAACRTFARPRERLVGSPLLEWVLPADRAGLRRLLEGVGETEGGTARIRIRRGDGLPRIQECCVSPATRVRERKGVLVFMRELADGRAGRPETLQLQTLLENLPGQFVLSLDTRGRIRYASGLGRTHFRDDGGALGVPYRDLVGAVRSGEDNVDRMFAELRRGRSWAGRQWHRRRDGTSIPVEVFASPHLDPRSGQVLGGLVVGRDLSGLEEWRRRAREAERLGAVGSLVVQVARALEDSLDRLEAALEGVDGTTAGGGAAQELSWMRALLERLEEFSSRGAIRRVEVRMDAVLGRVLERASARMAALGVHPRLEVPEGLPPVHADPRYVERLLEILVENALDALETAPAPRRLGISAGSTAGSVVVRIVNSGADLPGEWLDEIFVPFFTTRPRGIGLGLSVAEGIVRAHEGRIWAETPEPGLVSVGVELPREGEEETIPFRPMPLSLDRRRTVLVVDDDESIRDALRAFLEKVGYEVREAWSGRSAMAQLTAGKLPEVVVTDLRMSDGSGYWFLGELHRQYPELVRRTVIVTGDSNHAAADELSRRTGCPLVRKPFELSHLLDVLDRVLLRT